MLGAISFMKREDISSGPLALCGFKSNRKAMNRNWSNQKAYPGLKTKAGNK